MKVQELRNLLKDAERENLEKAFVECYKQLRKGQKEEGAPVLIALLEGKAAQAKAEASMDFETLAQQITEFIDNAHAGNYFAPNRIIPKSQRPKWRFMVKNFIKELSKVPLESADYERSVKLLTDLYALICVACNYYLFSTEDAFRSIGWGQRDFFTLVMTRTFADGYSREKIARLLSYAVSGGLSRESLHVEQEMALVGGLKTSDVKYMAIEEAQKQVQEKENKLAGLKKYDSKRYELEEAVDELCGLIFLITIALGEPEKGVEYYFKHSKESDKEITLYRVLRLADWMDEEELWLEVYKYGLAKKIKPRDRLREEYERRLRERGTETGKSI